MDILLKNILNIQSESGNQVDMQNYILSNYPTAEMDKKGNIYITKGQAENYPCVVAHLDTVHDIIDKDHYHILETDGKAFAWNSDTMLPTGIGGDDKCGIYIALHCLEHFDNIKIAFFVDEEIGCVGSRQADMTFFNNVSYAIQCDRKGYEDVVTNILFTEICSVDFEDDISDIVDSWGKSFCTNGGMTDVYQLKENGLGVSAINLSCGYYRPHSDEEYIDLTDLQDTRDFVIDVIERLGSEVYYHETSYTGYKSSYTNKHATKYGYKYFGDGYYEEDYDDFYDTLQTESDDIPIGKKEWDTCPHCESCDVMEDDTIDFLYCFNCDDYVVDLTIDKYAENNR